MWRSLRKSLFMKEAGTRKTVSRTGTGDREHSLQLRRLTHSRPEGSKDREYPPQTRMPTKYKPGKSSERGKPTADKNGLQLRIPGGSASGQNDRTRREQSNGSKEQGSSRYASLEESKIRYLCKEENYASQTATVLRVSTQKQIPWRYKGKPERSGTQSD